MSAAPKGQPPALLWATLSAAWSLDIVAHGYVDEMVGLLRAARASLLAKGNAETSESEIAAAQDACASVTARGVVPSKRAPQDWAAFLRSDDAGVMIALLPQRARAKALAKSLAPPTLRPVQVESGKGTVPLAEATRGQVERVKLADIDLSVVVRAARIDPEHLAEMVEARRRGVEFPPFPLFRDSEVGTLYMPDGQHRREMYLKVGEVEVDAVVYAGGRRDAFLYALRLDQHLPRSTKDKQFCLEILLKDPEWVTWTNPVLADIAGVDEKTVQAARRRLGLISAPRQARNGRIYRPRQAAKTVCNPEIPDCSSTTTEPAAPVIARATRRSNPEIPDCSAANSEPPDPLPAPAGQTTNNPEIPDCSTAPQGALLEPIISQANDSGWANIVLELSTDGTPVAWQDGTRTILWRIGSGTPGSIRLEGQIQPRAATVVTRRGDVTTTIRDSSHVTAAVRKLRGE